MPIKLKSLLNESGFARVGRIMRGLVPSVKTLAFLTAENPLGKSAPAEQNNAAMKKLMADLRQMNLGFTPIKGKYGSPEKSLFVPNISKDEAMELGKKYNQESVIVGEMVKDGSSDGMKFQMIRTDDQYGDVDGERTVFIDKSDADNYYSEVKGRKFQIPFFDDAYAGVNFEPKSGVIPKKDVANEDIRRLNNQLSKINESGRTAKSRWLNRGRLNQMIFDAYNKR